MSQPTETTNPTNPTNPTPPDDGGDDTRITHRDLMEKFRRYAELAHDVQIVNPTTGETMSVSEWEDERDALKNAIKRGMEQHGETALQVEGYPPLDLVPSSGGYEYDVKSWWNTDNEAWRADLERAIELGAATMDTGTLERLATRGQITRTFDRFRWKKGRSPSLRWRKPK